MTIPLNHQNDNKLNKKRITSRIKEFIYLMHIRKYDGAVRKLSQPRPSLILFLPIILALLGLWLPSCTEVVPADATRGLANFSDSPALLGGGLLRLSGEWEFYPGTLLGPGEFESGSPSPGAYVKLPGLWESVQGFSRWGHEPVGVATLRLSLRLPPGSREWGIRLPNANSAVRLYVDGKELAQVGRVADIAQEYMPSNALAYQRFTTQEGAESVNIILQVANYSSSSLGMEDCPVIGLVSALEEKRQSDTIVDALVAGALLIMGLYHLGLFILRRRDLAPLIFALICILMMVRTLFMGERILHSQVPPTQMAWAWAFKLEVLSVHLVLPLFAVFFRLLFPKRVRLEAVIAMLGVGTLWLAIVLLSSPMFYMRFVHWYEYFVIVSGLYLFGTVAWATARREPGALVVLIGSLLLLAAVLNDVLLSTGAVRSSYYLVSYGVFAFVFAQSLYLSLRFSRVFGEIESLSSSLSAKKDELESLHTIDIAIVSSEDLEGVLEIILRQAIDRLKVDAADILLYDASTGELNLAARQGFRTSALLYTRLRSGEGFAGQALQSGETIFVQDLDSGAKGFLRSPSFQDESFVSYAGKRLVVKGKIVGVLELYARSHIEREQSWHLYFRALAGQAAVALDNATLLKGLRRANEELLAANEATMEGWAEALELRDQETEGHSRRVTTMTLDLARAFNIPPEDLDGIRYGAFLHDIGKMGIPDSILLKPGPLSPEEFEIMKRHPAIARSLLSRISFLQKSLDIPYCHHEKWDGSGYPQGLAGESIPLAARLFAIVDVWDALRSDRPYRRAWPEDRALGHIAALSGSHFDPRVVEVFMGIKDKPGLPEKS